MWPWSFAFWKDAVSLLCINVDSFHSLQTRWESAETHGWENASKIDWEAIGLKNKLELFCFCGCTNADVPRVVHKNISVRHWFWVQSAKHQEPRTSPPETNGGCPTTLLGELLPMSEALCPVIGLCFLIYLLGFFLHVPLNIGTVQ